MNHANHYRIFHPAHRPHPKKHQNAWCVVACLDMSLADGFGGPTHVEGIDGQITWREFHQAAWRCLKMLREMSFNRNAANSKSGNFRPVYYVQCTTKSWSFILLDFFLVRTCWLTLICTNFNLLVKLRTLQTTESCEILEDPNSFYSWGWNNPSCQLSIDSPHFIYNKS